MLTEMKTYIYTFKPKVFLERENHIYDNVNIINQISELPNKSRLNYNLKCIPFFHIQMLMGHYKKYISD